MNFEYKFNFFNSENFMSPFDFDVERELKITERSVTYSDDSIRVVEEIHRQYLEVHKNGFQPEFLLMNQNNYEKLIGYLCYNNYKVPVEEFEGMKIVVWDVPVDYINVRAKASTEWSYGESVRK